MSIQCAVLSNRYGPSGFAATSSKKPNKSEYEKYCFIKLENYSSIVKPHTVIRGNFHVEEDKIPKSVRTNGIRIQLDATVNLKLPLPDHPNKIQENVEGLFEGCSKPGNADYIKAPEGSRTVIELKPGVNVYPFELTFPNEPLPSPFSSVYGNLTYRVAAYHKDYKYYELAQQPLKFNGYKNLCDHEPTASEPINMKCELSYKKSLFSQKSFTDVFLFMDKQGFLLGEKLPFKLTINNPSCFAVQESCLKFIRRSTYQNHQKGLKKKIVDVIDVFRNQEVKTDAEIVYQGVLTMPPNCAPTYQGKLVYSVNYFVQYDLAVAEMKNKGPITGEVEVIIGTNSEPVVPATSSIETETISSPKVTPTNKGLITQRRNTIPLLDNKGEDGSPGRERSTGQVGSDPDCSSSTLSEDSIMTSTASVPPAYSQLPSRAVSKLSIETLPPHYNEIN